MHQSQHTQQNGAIQQNGLKAPPNQLHHQFTDYCLNKNEAELILSPNEELINLQNRQTSQQFQTQQQFNKYIANLNQLNSINANANQFQTHANELKELNGFTINNIHSLNQPQTAECQFIPHPNSLYSTQQQQHSNVPINHQLQSSNLLLSTDQAQATIIKQNQQPLQLIIEDQSDLNTTDINMDSCSSPCSESASDLKQFGGRPHKDGKFGILKLF